MANRLAKKVLLIGWGSADWKMINPLVDAGKLPAIQKLLKEGTKTALGNLDPPLPSANWTSLITGKVPAKHNIFTFTEPSSESITPVSVNSRRAMAIWNILSEKDLKVHQVGAWASHPVEKINGISISDWFTHSTTDTLDDAVIAPLSQKETFKKLLVSSDDITDEQLKEFIDDASVTSSSEYEENKLALKKFVAGIHSIQAAALQILANEEWDQVSIFFNQLSNLTFRFMPYHIEKGDLPKDLVTVFKNVLVQAYVQLDAYLGELLKHTDDQTAIFIVSQGGYLPDETWINNQNKPYSGWEYNTPGICLWSLPNVSQKEEMFGMGLMDVLPTILTLLGLPFAKDFDGKLILSQKILKEVSNVVETYEKFPNQPVVKELGDGGQTILEQQLLDLSYITDSKYHIKELNNYYLARTLISVGKSQEVISILEDLWARYPDNGWYGGRLAGNYLALGNPEEGLAVLDSVLALGDEIPELHILRAQAYLMEKKFRSAVKEFDIAEKNVGQSIGVYPQIANGYLQMNQWQIAVKKLKKEVEHHPNPQHYMTMGMLFIQNRMTKPAIKPLEKAAELVPMHPTIQFHLGNCYYQNLEYQKAADALEKAKVYMNDPKGRLQINQQLITIYRNHLNRPDKIKEMREAAEKVIGSRGTITIVSGLPRSGTSMMMQMLVKGGMLPFTDGKREADDNNKKGYYEHEAVKNLSRDKKFLSGVGDQAIKIISHLLVHLPNVYKYKIVFMDRDIEEVMNSQHKMLGRMGKERGNDKANSMRLLKPFKESREKAIKWCEAHKKHVDLLLVPYTEALNNPLEQAKHINEFLGGNLDELAMASVVDKSLYRERTEVSD